MGLIDVLLKVQSSDDIYSTNNRGIIGFRVNDKFDEYVIFNREVGDFMRSGYISCDGCDKFSFKSWLGESLEHADDLLQISKKYGLRTAAGYETGVFMADFKVFTNTMACFCEQIKDNYSHILY